MAGAATPVITGAGATVPAPLLRLWADRLGGAAMFRFAYRPIGSGAGVEAITARSVDFGASDIPLHPPALERHGLVQFPMLRAALSVVAHLPGIGQNQLRLDPDLLLDIFAGRIRAWSDPRLRAANPDLVLPHLQITPIVRADRSGSSDWLAKYIARGHPNLSADANRALAQPFGLAAFGGYGMASTVARIEGAIGYVELSMAVEHGLTRCALRAADGRYSRLVRSTLTPGNLGTGPGWPIIFQSHALLAREAGRRDLNAEVIRFFELAFQKGDELAWEAGFAPLDAAAKASARNAWTELAQGD